MKIAVVGGVVVGLALAAYAGYWFGHADSRGTPAPSTASAPVKGGPGGPGPGAQAVSVEIARVSEMALPQTITTVGSLRSDESVTLRPEVAGRIASIQFQEGQRVAKGALLVRLDTSINEAEVQQAKANYTLAKSKYDRAVDLAKSNFISGQARDEAENNLRVAEAAVTLAQARLDKTQIRAPFAGVIGLRSVSAGDYVKEGADMVNLESIDPLKVDFRVPEVYLTQVSTGQVLSVVLDAFPGKEFPGRVVAVNPLIDAAGRAVVIRAQVQNAQQTLRPGMFARVRLVTKDLGKSLVIPEQAVVPQGDEQYVFRVVDGKAVRTRVETGQRRDAKVEVVKGLTPADVVVVAGQLKLRDGVQVAVANPPPAPAAAGAKPDGAAAPAARAAAVADARS